MYRHLFGCLFILSCLFMNGCYKNDTKTVNSPVLEKQLSKLSIITTSGQTFDFSVELALDDQEHAKGLMFREFMPEDQGMLFVFPRDKIHTFWMKNTLIPLDMLFISSSGEVVGIVHDAAPMSLNSRSVGKPSRYVLELNGGICKKLGIDTGSQITFPDNIKD